MKISLVIAGILFIFALLFGDLWLMILTAFIGFGAVSEYRSLVLHRSFKTLRISKLLSSEYVVVKSKDNVLSLMSDILRLHTFTVLVEGNPFKIADIRSVQNIDEKNRAKSVFEDIAVNVPKFTLRSSIESVYFFLSGNGLGMAPIYDGKNIIGVVKLSDIERARQSVELLRANE